MYTVRAALLTHLADVQVPGGLAVIKEYQGEVHDALEDPHALMDIMPAVLVIVREGKRRRGHGLYHFDCLVASFTRGFDQEDSADDALVLTEGIVDWMENNFHWMGGDRHYSIDTDAGIRMALMTLRPDYAIYGVSFEVKEV
jgi:hypothetical protein